MAIDFEIMTGCFGSQAASRYSTTWEAGIGHKRKLTKQKENPAEAGSQY
jgi:hypothetical protein